MTARFYLELCSLKLSRPDRDREAALNAWMARMPVCVYQALAGPISVPQGSDRRN